MTQEEYQKASLDLLRALLGTFQKFEAAMESVLNDPNRVQSEDVIRTELENRRVRADLEFDSLQFEKEKLAKVRAEFLKNNSE